MKNLINKGPAHCWSETMHKDYWNKMRQRTSGVAGRGGGNDIALKNAVEKRGPAKVTSKDALNVATNFLKGTGGMVASMLSTTKAEAGQNVRSQAQFNETHPTNKEIVHDGGELPKRLPTTKGAGKKKTSCWKGYSNIVNGKPTFKKKGKRMVPDCKPTGKKK
tara:strand:+ start:81 stop:569 length:489 start_codon:yes stop_codon:yes gene_type:complete